MKKKKLCRLEKFVSKQVGMAVILWEQKVWSHRTGEEAAAEVTSRATEILEASALKRKEAYDLVFRVFPQVDSPKEAANRIAEALGLNDLQEQRLRKVFVPNAWDHLWKRKESLADLPLTEIVRKAVYGTLGASAWPGEEDAKDWWREEWYRAPQLVGRSIIIKSNYRCVNPGVGGRSYQRGPYGDTREMEGDARELTFLPKGKVEVKNVPAPKQEKDLHLIGAGDSSACLAASKQYPIVDIWI